MNSDLNPSLANDDPGARHHLRHLNLSIKDHDICFVVPAGSKIDAHRLDLPGGILILGALRGRVFCASGSAIVAAGGEFQGDLDAVNVYVEGKVTSAKRGVSRLKARGVVSDQATPSGGLAAFGVGAHVHAHVQAHAFHVPRQATFLNSVFEALS